MTEPLGRLARLPLRVRLVAGFTTVMLVVLAGAGAFVYWRVAYALDRQLDSQLVDTAGNLSAVVAPDGTVTDESGLESDESYQVLDAAGHLLSSGPTPSTAPVIDASTVHEAFTHPVQEDIGTLLSDDSRPLRVYATALDDSGGVRKVLVVTVERNRRDEALRELLVQLAVAGLATLLITAVVGDRLAHASLRPVERYRRQAADIAAGATGVRLDVPSDREDEITRLGHTLNDMLVALERALEHERRFVNDASHELRTPLTLIRTRVQLALRRQRTPAQHEQVLAEIDADIGRLSRLADELLAVGSRTGEGTDSADLAAVVRSEVERRRTLSPAGTPYSRSGALVAETAGPVMVAVPRPQLERLVGNLLDNAALHGLPPVTLAVDIAGVLGRLVVTDSGPGMDEQMLATAPDRFARAPQARTRPGSGLGLALVHAVVTAAGGELRLCFGAVHRHFGTPAAVRCEHDRRMSVTVLLPTGSAATGRAAPAGQAAQGSGAGGS